MIFASEKLDLGIKSLTDMLKIIPVEDFQRCYQKWEQFLHRCVAAQGNYFEGDNIDVWKNKNFDKYKINLITFFCHTSHVFRSPLEFCQILLENVNFLLY